MLAKILSFRKEKEAANNKYPGFSCFISHLFTLFTLFHFIHILFFLNLPFRWERFEHSFWNMKLAMLIYSKSEDWWKERLLSNDMFGLRIQCHCTIYMKKKENWQQNIFYMKNYDKKSNELIVLYILLRLLS